MTNYDPSRSTKILRPDPPRLARIRRREAPEMDGEVTHVRANYLATVIGPRDGTVIIDTDDKHAAEIRCTYLTATPWETALYSLIDDRPFEIVTLGDALPDTGPLMASHGGPFERVYRLVERPGTGRWELRNVLVLADRSALDAYPQYRGGVVRVGTSARGNALRLQPWPALLEGPTRTRPGNVRRVRP